jgi:hypothetical protein
MELQVKAELAIGILSYNSRIYPICTENFPCFINFPEYFPFRTEYNPFTTDYYIKPTDNVPQTTLNLKKILYFFDEFPKLQVYSVVLLLLFQPPRS